LFLIPSLQVAGGGGGCPEDEALPLDELDAPPLELDVPLEVTPLDTPLEVAGIPLEVPLGIGSETLVEQAKSESDTRPNH
jgi:hypothetical protein